MNIRYLLAALLFSLCSVVACSSNDGAMEEAGESMDEAVEDTGDAIEDATD